MCDGSDIDTAGIGDLSSLNFPVNSSAKCIASHIEPPLPQEMIFPPLLILSVIIFADSSMALIIASSLINLSITFFASLSSFKI